MTFLIDEIANKDQVNYFIDLFTCDLCSNILDSPVKCKNTNCQKYFCKTTCSAGMKVCPNCKQSDPFSENNVIDKMILNTLDKFKF